MELSAIVSLKDGMEEPYVLYWPIPQDGVPLSATGAACMVISKRQGGLLLAIPTGVLSEADLAGVSDADETSVLGPFQEMVVPAVRDDGAGTVSFTGTDVDVLVIDVSLEILPGLFRLSDAGVSPGDLLCFGAEVEMVPDVATLMQFVQEWLEGSGSEVQRMSFYSAQESEELAETPTGTSKARGAKPKPKPTGAPKAGSKEPPKEVTKKATPAKMVAEQIKVMSSLLPKLAAQMEDIQKEQMRMREVVHLQGVSPPARPSQQPVTMLPQQFAELVGPPPRTKTLAMSSPPPMPTRRLAQTPQLDATVPIQEQTEVEQIEEGNGDHLARAVLEQSRALTTLVAHLQAGDPLLDSQATSSGNTSRGAVGREKLQKELGARTGDFMLAVTQNMFRRLSPAAAIPQTLEEMAMTNMSMLQYLERFGGYGNCKDMGVVQYALSFILDMAVRGDMKGIQEHLALLVVGIDQYVQDGGRWDMGFQLMLLEDPPHQMWSYKNPVAVQTGRVRAFSPLCPQKWATISIAYTKEIDYILSRRLELAKKANPVPPPLQPDLSPKKKKFPKGKSSAGEREKDDQPEV